MPRVSKPPPASTPPKKRKQSKSAPSPGPAPETNEQQPSEYQLVQGRDEILQLWQGLKQEEKLSILDVELEELQEQLVKAGGYDPELFPVATLDALLDNAEFMTSLRLIVVQGIALNRGKIEIPNQPLVICIVQIIEQHLVLLYARQNTQYRLFLFALFWFWTSDLHWFWRIILCGIVCFLCVSTRWRLKQCRDWILKVFDDRIPDRLESRLLSFLAASLALFLGRWLRWFWVPLCFVCLLPLGLIEIERKMVSIVDKNSLSKVRLFLSWVLYFVCLYICLYSFWATLFCFCFFFPSLSSITFQLLALALLSVSRLILYLKERFPALNLPQLKSFLLSGSGLLIFWFWALHYSFWLWLPLLAGVLLVAPPMVYTVTMAGCVLAQKLIPTFVQPVNAVHLGVSMALLCTAAVIAAAKEIQKRYVNWKNSRSKPSRDNS
eukprot:TRINITY_DN20136_c0_g1_i2.p1 TRINITY_DN20136_c0_g1~~TRINITY_DN20136_c0_g1_i2.p1  ORF type:complete len:437 (-),score=14.80 TRINITY_DN20136_c0_g1_i2:29-1339(-)